MELLISLMTFITVFLLLQLGLRVYAGGRQNVAMRLRRITGTENGTAGQKIIEQELSRPLHLRVLRPLLQRLSGYVARMAPASVKRRFAERLTEAGGFGGLSANEVVLCSIFFAIGLPVTLCGVGLLFHISLQRLLGVAMILFVLGLCVPNILLTRKIDARRRNMQRDLPDVLDLLTVSVEAGLAFDGALSKLAEKMHGALVEEFIRLLNEIRMGMSRRDALSAMAKRCHLEDLTLLVSALIQADQLGVSVSNVLRVQSETMRRKRRQRAEEQAMKAPIKMLLPLVVFIFPTIFIILLGPAAIQMMKVFSKM